MMFVEQKKPSWWTLFFACVYLISGVGVFVLGLLAKDVWQILSGLFLFRLASKLRRRIYSSFRFSIITGCFSFPALPLGYLEHKLGR